MTVPDQAVDAVAFWDARQYSGSGDLLDLIGSSDLALTGVAYDSGDDAFVLDGVGDFLGIAGDPSSFDPLDGSFTAVAVVRIDAVPANVRPIFSKWDHSTARGWRIQLGGGGAHAVMQVWTPTWTGNSGADFNLGDRVMLTLRRSGDDLDARAGNEGPLTTPMTAGAVVNSPLGLYVGAQGAGGASDFMEMRYYGGGFWSRALSDCDLGRVAQWFEAPQRVDVSDCFSPWVLGAIDVGGYFPPVELDSIRASVYVLGGAGPVTTSSITLVPDRAYVLHVYDHASSTPSAGPGVTGLGLTWTPVYSSTVGDPGTRLTVYKGVGTPVTGQLTFTNPGPGNFVSFGWVLATFEGVDKADPVVQVTHGEAFAANGLTVTLPAFSSPRNRGFAVASVAEQRASSNVSFGDGYTKHPSAFAAGNGAGDNFDITVVGGFADATNDPSASFSALVTNEWQWLTVIELRNGL